jgi:hypothetical protein
MLEGYTILRDPKTVPIGTEVILEQKHFDYKKGFPLESTYYRTILREHRTVGGMTRTLFREPNWEWPEIPHWQGNWIYAGNSGTSQMWVKEEHHG